MRFYYLDSEFGRCCQKQVMAKVLLLKKVGKG